MRHLEQSNSQTGNRMVVARVQEQGREELEFHRYQISVWEDKKVVKANGGDGCTTVQMYLALLSHTLISS